ncbi:replicative DNA helicase [Clostridium sp. UBA5712]|uniref:replicative DNA helicase n=1 Tax=Clostridium sp. UBA5712 TaxID=1946368 RepID=UPI003216BA58
MNNYYDILLDKEIMETENNFIAALLADITLIHDIKIKPINITNEKDRHILKAVLKLGSENRLQGKGQNDLDIFALFEELKGNLTITELTTLMSNGNIYKNSFDTLQNKILNNSNKIKCVEISREINKKIINGDEPSIILNYITNKLEEVETMDKSINSISDVMMSTLDLIETSYKQGGKLIGMPTGYKKLDGILNGIEKKKYIIIGARPATGKTTFSLELAKRLGKKNKVLYFSLEMPKEELGQRLISNMCCMNSYKIKNGSLNQEEFKRVMDSMNELSKLNIEINDTESLKVEELIRQCISKKHKQGLDVVVVDYLTLLDTEESYRDERIKFNIISNKLRGLSKKLDIAVICLAQLNRAIESRADKKPIMSDLRETGNIEQDSNIVLLLHTEEGEGEKDKASTLNVIVAKNRGGAAPIEPVEFNYYKKTQIIDEKYI